MRSDGRFVNTLYGPNINVYYHEWDHVIHEWDHVLPSVRHYAPTCTCGLP